MGALEWGRANGSGWLRLAAAGKGDGILQRRSGLLGRGPQADRKTGPGDRGWRNDTNRQRMGSHRPPVWNPSGSFGVWRGLRVSRAITHTEEAEHSADLEGREEGWKSGSSGPRGPAGPPRRTAAGAAPDRRVWLGSRRSPKLSLQPDPVGRRDRAHTDDHRRRSSRGRRRRARRAPVRRTCPSTPRFAAWPSALQGRANTRAQAGTGSDDATLRRT